MIHLPAIADALARIAILVSVYGALVMAAFLLFLVMRRDRKERRLAQSQTNARALLREVMTAVTRGGETGPAYAKAIDEERLAAVTHLSQLVRGEDRERLTEFVERNRLLEAIADRARRGSRAKRVDAIRLLGNIGGVQAVSTLTGIIRDDRDPALQLEAAAMLAKLSALPAPDVLITALDLERASVSRVHRALFRALAPAHAAELRRLAGRRLPSGLRAVIIDALGWTGDYSGLPALAEAAKDPDPEIRLSALRAARRIDHPASAGWVLALLDDPDETVRAQAALGCAALGLRRAVPQLDAMRTDKSAWVRLRAGEALQALRRAPA
ncbi:HEAT repeat domain-containing protein [Sphingomonas cannabina]|uniref:HEAT repeat domain-containing protein n=1 Tax=Sphingomonas cannabina TaxID=2899123 RepID=UPI001F2ED7E2|nr:HEAT repeat domain-containing protein [Sphingomonas cannabina]UIJ46631.1 HEAT repeat domain-containing protein [Sphingomonas cannabina]